MCRKTSASALTNRESEHSYASYAKAAPSLRISVTARTGRVIRAHRREALDRPISLEIVGMLPPPTGRIARFRHVRRDL